MATEAFVHQGSPQRVVFGAGTLAEVREEARRPLDRGAIRALLDDAWHGRRPMGGTS